MKHQAYAFLCLAISAVSAQAGLVIKSETRDLRTASPTVSSSVISIDGDNLRMDHEEGIVPGGKMSVIFRGSEPVIWNVDHTQKQYMEINSQMAANVSDRQQQAMTMMQERMQGMPPEQRAMMDRMMQGRMSPSVRNPTMERSVTMTAEQAEINGVLCSKYEILRGGQVVREVWAAPWESVGITSEDMEVIRSMAAFQKGLISSMTGGEASTPGSAFDDFEKIDGYPVVIKQISNGMPTRETTLQVPESADVDFEIFVLPEGYIKRGPMQLQQ